MPQVHVKKSNTKKILVLVAVLLLCLGVIGAVSFWEAGQEKEAMSVQAEIDESARRRREGWSLVCSQAGTGNDVADWSG